MLQIAMHDSICVDLLKTVGDLGYNDTGMLFRELVHAKGAQVAKEVATTGQLRHDVGLAVEAELLDEVQYVRTSLAHVHCATLAHLVLNAQALVFFGFHGLDCDADA